MAKREELEKLHAQERRDLKALNKELQRKEKALAGAAALLVLRKGGKATPTEKPSATARRTRKADGCRWRQSGERLL
jgi:hypothetical protein